MVTPEIIFLGHFLVRFGLGCRELFLPRVIEHHHDKIFFDTGFESFLREDFFIQLDARRAPVGAGELYKHTFFLCSGFFLSSIEVSEEVSGLRGGSEGD